MATEVYKRMFETAKTESFDTVGDLMKLLSKLDPETQVLLSNDSEGNRLRMIGEIIDDQKGEYSNDGESAVVLYPSGN